MKEWITGKRMVKAREVIYFNLIGIGLKELEQELNYHIS